MANSKAREDGLLQFDPGTAFGLAHSLNISSAPNSIFYLGGEARWQPGKAPPRGSGARPKRRGSDAAVAQELLCLLLYQVISEEFM